MTDEINELHVILSILRSSHNFRARRRLFLSPRLRFLATQSIQLRSLNGSEYNNNYNSYNNNITITEQYNRIPCIRCEKHRSLLFL